MSQLGKSHLMIVWTVGADDVGEGDRIFASPGPWMKGHPREGDVALLEYTVSKGPELSNPLDRARNSRNLLGNGRVYGYSYLTARPFGKRSL